MENYEEKKIINNESTIAAFSRGFVALYLSASKEERRGLLKCYKSGRDLQGIETRMLCMAKRD